MEIKRPKSLQPLPENAKKVFKGVIFDVYQYEQVLHDGSKTIYEKLKRLDTAVVIPVTKDKKIIIQKENQAGKEQFIALPGGILEEGEDPLSGAKRELLEETGYASDDWDFYFAVQPSAKIDWAIYFFIARGCKKISEQHLDAGEKIELDYLDFEQFLNIVMHEDFSESDIKMRVLEAKTDIEKMEKLRQALGV